MDRKEINSDMKRGCVCSLEKKIHKSLLSIKDWKQHRILKEKKAVYYLVMKCVEEDQLLLVEVFETQKKDTTKVVIDGRTFWAKHSNFLVVPKCLMKLESEKRLDKTMEMVSVIYENHNRYIKNRRKENDKRKMLDEQWDIVLKESQKRRDEYYRMKAPMEEIQIPDYMVKNAMHPYLGGGVNPR